MNHDARSPESCPITCRQRMVMWLSLLLIALPAQARADQDIRVPDNLCSWPKMNWRDLNGAEKSAWTGLGWTADVWDNAEPAGYPPSYRKSWPQLRYTEKMLARKLGYSSNTWDADGCPNYSTWMRKKRAGSKAASTGSWAD